MGCDSLTQPDLLCLGKVKGWEGGQHRAGNRISGATSSTVFCTTSGTTVIYSH